MMADRLRLPVARLAVFIALAATAFPLCGMLVGVTGASGSAGAVWFGAFLSVALALATVLVARLTGERLSELGFALSKANTVTAVLGFAVGAGTFAAVAFVLGYASGGAWQLNPSASVGTALAGLVPVLGLLLGEELLFRGYAFQQLRRIYGTRAALVLSAAAFGAYHLLGSGDWAMGAVFRFLMPALGGLVFGYALVRTGSIAVPIGLHWGGNWVQTMVLGLGPAPEATPALWVMPLTPTQVNALAAPDLLPHLPYLGALLLALLFVHYWPARPGLTARSS